MIKRFLYQIFYISIWIGISMGFIYIFFRVTRPENNITYNFVNANSVTIDGIGFFADSDSGMMMDFDTDNIEENQLCYLLIEFKSDSGELCICDWDQEDDTSLNVEDRYEVNYNSEKDFCETAYIIGFSPRFQKDSAVYFWEGMPYSLAVSLFKTSSIEEDSVSLTSFRIEDQCFENQIHIDDGSLEMTGFMNILGLNDFLIIKIKTVGGTNENGEVTYEVTDEFSIYDTKKYITFMDYKLSYIICDKEPDNPVHNTIPVTLAFESKIENNQEIVMRGIKAFNLKHSDGTLLCYTTANPIEYKVNGQEVFIYSKNFEINESRANLKFEFPEEQMGYMNGYVTIMEGDGTIAGKNISPQFINWFYGNYFAIALTIFSAIFGNYLMISKKKEIRERK